MVAVLTVLTNDAQCGISFCFTADRFDFRNRVLFRRPHFLCRQISDRCSLVVTAQFYLLQKYNSELREQDSNLRPLGYEPSELPNCYHRAILTIQPSRYSTISLSASWRTYPLSPSVIGGRTLSLSNLRYAYNMVKTLINFHNEVNNHIYINN